MISTSTNRDDYTGDGTITLYPYTFKIFSESEMTAYLDGVLTTAYTLTDVGDDSGGNLIFTIPPGNTVVITLLRVVTENQSLDIPPNTPMPEQSLEEALDKLTMIAQQISEKQRRAFVLPIESQLSEPIFPDSPSPGNKLIRWNPAGNKLELVVASDVGFTTIVLPSLIKGSPIYGTDPTSLTNVPSVKYAGAYADFETAISEIGASVTTLIVTEIEGVANNVAIPSTLTLDYQGLGGLSVNSGKVVTIDSLPDAWPKRQIFSGSGTVSIGGKVAAHWWGLLDGGTAINNTAAIVAAINSLSGASSPAGGIVQIPRGTYDVNTANIIVPTDVRLIGEGMLNTRLLGFGGGNIVQVGTPSVHTNRAEVSGIYIQGEDTTASTALHIYNAEMCKFDDLFLGAGSVSPSGGGGICLQIEATGTGFCQFNKFSRIRLAAAGGHSLRIISAASPAYNTAGTWSHIYAVGSGASAGERILTVDTNSSSHMFTGFYFEPSDKVDAGVKILGKNIHMINGFIDGHVGKTALELTSNATDFKFIGNIDGNIVNASEQSFILSNLSLDYTRNIKLLTGVGLTQGINWESGASGDFGFDILHNRSTDKLLFRTRNGSGVTNNCFEIARDTGDFKALAGIISRDPITFTSADATPTVKGGNVFRTAGSTAITDFDDGVVGQTIRILAVGSITITNGSPIKLQGAGNYAMTAGDTLVLTMYEDQVWHENARSVN